MLDATHLFAVPIFFIVFRECLETVIIVSVLLSFLKKTLASTASPALYRRLRNQIWYGVGAGLAITLIIGGGLIGAFYGYGQDKFSNGLEDIWEGAFSLLAALIISLMGAALLRVSKLQAKWRRKLQASLDKSPTTTRGAWKRWSEQHALFLLPFVTVLREGLEAVVFIAGVSLGLPATAFPLAVVCGVLVGVLVGWAIYKVGNVASLQIFLIVSTCFLYLVAAGLFSKGVWFLENHAWAQLIGSDAAELGSGPGSYDIRQSVWHVNCCNPNLYATDGGWAIFNALFGWQNSATYGSVLSYNLYWACVIIGFSSLLYAEKHGRWPWQSKASAAEKASSQMTAASAANAAARTDSNSDDNEGGVLAQQVVAVAVKTK